MDRQDSPTTVPTRAVQQARLAIRIGDKATITAEVTVTSAGLLAIGALVSSILLSTAVIVGTATRRRPTQ